MLEKDIKELYSILEESEKLLASIPMGEDKLWSPNGIVLDRISKIKKVLDKEKEYIKPDLDAEYLLSLLAIVYEKSSITNDNLNSLVLNELNKITEEKRASIRSSPLRK